MNFKTIKSWVEVDRRQWTDTEEEEDKPDPQNLGNTPQKAALTRERHRSKVTLLCKPAPADWVGLLF